MSKGKRPGTIPPSIQKQLKDRLTSHALKAWKERCAHLEVSFRGRFAAVDVFQWDAEAGDVEKVPTHLCRLEYVGRRDLWGFAFYKYSEERYERSYLPNGSMGGTPEECFDCAGSAYLIEA